MSDRPGPGAGNVIAGIFIILFGLCLALIGGGCTFLFYGEAPLLLTLIILAGGLVMIGLGVKMMLGHFSGPYEPPPP